MIDERTESEIAPDISPTTDEHPPENRSFSAIDDLRMLAPGEKIMVTRNSPSYAEGFLDHITVPDDGLNDLLGEIRSNWGGGTFALQAKVRAANGKLLFGSRAITVRIAGEPVLNGRKYTNGVLEPVQAAPQPIPQVVLQNPAQNGLEGLQAQLLGLVQHALSGARAGDGSGGSVDVVGLLKAFQGFSGAPQQRDAFGDLERSLGLIGKLQRTFQGGNAQPAQVESESGLGGMLGGEMNLEKLLMLKMLGGSGGMGELGSLLGMPQEAPKSPPQPTAEQMWQQAQWSQPQNQAGVSGAPFASSPGQVPYDQHGQRVPNAPAPHGNPSASARGCSGASCQGPVGPTDAHNSGGPAAPSTDSTYEPITIDELMQELGEKSESDRLEFVAQLAERIGFDKSVLAGLSSVMQKSSSADPSNGKAWPNVDINQSFPEGKSE